MQKKNLSTKGEKEGQSRGFVKAGLDVILQVAQSVNVGIS